MTSKFKIGDVVFWPAKGTYYRIAGFSEQTARWENLAVLVNKESSSYWFADRVILVTDRAKILELTLLGVI